MNDVAARIAEVLAENGFAADGSNPHSWRCEYPDRYPGFCTCIPELIAALRPILADVWDEGDQAACDGGPNNPYRPEPK